MDRASRLRRAGQEHGAWKPALWRAFPVQQQPNWTDSESRDMRAILSALPPLSSPGEIRNLRSGLAEVAEGRAFLLHAGDCAEPFGAAAVAGARDKRRVLGAMATEISERTGVPVLTVGRLAGQFGKPRSRDTEPVDGGRLPAFRGLLVNSSERSASARRAHPPRLLGAYRTARQVFAELHDASSEAYGRTTFDGSIWHHSGLWTSHETLVLDYEEPLTRWDPEGEQWYLASTHLPWIGARTNRPDGGHVVFLSGVSNPLACKVGPDLSPEDLVRVCARLDPDRTPGRLTLISRLGAGTVRDRLPSLVRAVRDAGHRVVWSCDPMHGNTVRTRSGFKTRHYGDIVDELRGFFDVLDGMSQWPGGVHLELAADDVTECVGGGGPDVESLPRAYRSLCDPRLNNVQSSSLAREIADLLSGETEDPSRVARLTVARN